MGVSVVYKIGTVSNAVAVAPSPFSRASSADFGGAYILPRPMAPCGGSASTISTFRFSLGPSGTIYYSSIGAANGYVNFALIL